MLVFCINFDSSNNAVVITVEAVILLDSSLVRSEMFLKWLNERDYLVLVLFTRFFLARVTQNITVILPTRVKYENVHTSKIFNFYIDFFE